MNESKTKVKGSVDGIFHQFLTGWFYPGEDDGDCQLQLFANGEELSCIDANLDRPDVGKNLGHGEKSGFCFDLRSLSADEVYELSIVNIASGFNFDGLELNYYKNLSDQIAHLKEIFFPEYYRNKYDLGSLSNDEAFQHYLNIGVYKDHNPCPWVSCEYIRQHNTNAIKDNELTIIFYLNNERKMGVKPSNVFDPEYYLASNPGIKNCPSLIGHFMIHGRTEGRSCVEHTVPNHIRNDLEEMLELEPMIRTVIPKLDVIVRCPLLNGATYLPRLLKNRFGNSIKAVICVPFISRGGADLVATYVLRAYQNAFGIENVLLIVTDTSTMEVPQWIAPGSNVVFFDNETDFISSEERVNALHNTIGLLAPEKVFNINSHTAWKMFSLYGAQLASVLDLYAFIFCFDFDKHGSRVGYISDYLPKTIKYLSAVFCDNKKIIKDIKNIYGFSHADMSILHTAYIPVPTESAKLDVSKNTSADKILWIGRLAQQKRPDILIDIAESMQNEQFVVYGAVGNSEFSQQIINGDCHNIEYREVYNDPSEIDFTEFKSFLNTSGWEGIPTIIIQMMSMGMPMLSSVVGGIGELLDANTGWSVDNCTDTQQYIDQIRRMNIQTDDVAERAEAGYNKVYEQHSWTGFYKKLESADAFTSTQEVERRNVVYIDRRRA